MDKKKLKGQVQSAVSELFTSKKDITFLSIAQLAFLTSLLLLLFVGQNVDFFSCVAIIYPNTKIIIIIIKK